MHKTFSSTHYNIFSSPSSKKRIIIDWSSNEHNTGPTGHTNRSDRLDRQKLEKTDTSLTQGLENFISTPMIFSDKS
jgi:hypothetical protein